jgi:hypothetical protein
MNSKTTIIGLVAAIAVLSGAMGLSVTGAFSDQTIAQYTTPATGFLMGQVMIEAHNENGELIAYRLGDNQVVDGGEQCILRMLFATAADGTGGPSANTALSSAAGSVADVCTGALTGAWNVIAIGVGTVGHGNAVDSGDGLDLSSTHDVYSGLELECGANVNIGVGGKTCAAGVNLNRATATTKTWQNGTAATPTQIVLAKTFTSSGTATITESGLFNSTNIATGGMLAHKTFAAVSLTDGDSITVTWTFKVGN